MGTYYRPTSIVVSEISQQKSYAHKGLSLNELIKFLIELNMFAFRESILSKID